MRLNAIILVLALVMGFSFAMSCAPSGGWDINTPGTYVMQDDFFGTCIYVMSNDVVINCNGHTIDCDGEEIPGIIVSADNVEIYGCTIQNCAAKAALHTFYSDDIYIHNNIVRNNPQVGIYIYSDDGPSNNVEISNNQVYGNGYSGISVYNAEFSEINDNLVYDNGMQGIEVSSSYEITIDPNTVYGNGHSGIYVDESESVYTLDNEIYDNCWGIPGNCGGIVYDHVMSSTIEGNEVYGHEYIYPAVYAGILLAPAAEVYVYDNEVYGNMYGIYELGSLDVTIEDCNVHDNAFWGIYLEDGVSSEVIGCRVNGNGFDGESDSSGLYADGEVGLWIYHSNFRDNQHGVALIDSGGFLEDVTISGSWIHGLAMDHSEFEFEDLALIDNWAAIGLEDESYLGDYGSGGLSIYGDTEVYLAMDDSCIGAWDIWLGFDRFYGVWYEGMEECDVWVEDGHNILLRSDFVSLDHEELDEFGEPDLVTTQVPSCNGVEHYYDEGFPGSSFQILDEGEFFEPDYSQCAGGRATYTPIDGGGTGYTATALPAPEKDSDDEPDYVCTKDSDCDECEYCSIANNACRPVSEPCGEEEPECTTDSDCPVGFLCENEECMEEPECTTDADCSSGFECIKEECVEIPEEPKTEEGGIVGKPCTSDEDCGDLLCSNNKCVAPPEPECTTDADCPDGMACKEEKCVEKEPEGPTAEDAEKAIHEAAHVIQTAKGEGKDTSGAEKLLEEAEEALSNGDNAGAIELAEKARLAAESATAPPEEEEVVISSEPLPEEKPPEQPPEEFPWLFVIGGIVILGIIAWFLLKGK